MSHEFYQTMARYHQDRAEQFSSSKGDGIRRHVECRIADDDIIYVYLYEDGIHVQTQNVRIPDRWYVNWPSDTTIRRYIRSATTIGSVRITNLNA
jgi:hypothetical protein